MATAVATTIPYIFPSSDIGYPGTGSAFLAERDHVPTTVNDARGRESSFSLDRQGFEFHGHTASEKEFPDDKERIKASYYPEIVSLIKEKTGASRVVPIDHLIRRQTYEAALQFAQTHDPMEKTNMKVPARFAHVDQSYTGAQTFMHDNLDASLVEKLTSSRWAIVNVWRPLKHLKRDPLGVCDGRSVQEEDLMERTVQLQGPNGKYEDVSKGDSFQLWSLLRPQTEGAHDWWYLSGMRPDEVMFIKCFDSKTDGRCRRAPHCAFQDPKYADAEARESIEIRCLVFWEDQDVE